MTYYPDSKDLAIQYWRTLHETHEKQHRRNIDAVRDHYRHKIVLLKSDLQGWQHYQGNPQLSNWRFVMKLCRQLMWKAFKLQVRHWREQLARRIKP